MKPFILGMSQVNVNVNVYFKSRLFCYYSQKFDNCSIGLSTTGFGSDIFSEEFAHFHNFAPIYI